MSRRRLLLSALVVAALLLLVGRWAATLYTDFLWYDALGASEVFGARIETTIFLDLAAFTAAWMFAFANLYAVRQSVVSLVLPRRIANLEIGEEVPSRYLLFGAAAVAALVSIAVLPPRGIWSDVLLAQIGVPFRDTDPYFGADLGFFVYWLPVEAALHYWAVLLLAVVSAAVVGLYGLTPSLRWESGRLYVSSHVRRHLTMLGAVLLLVLAWSYRLEMYALVATGGGTGGVFTSVDHRVLVPAMLLLAVVTLCAGLVVAWAGWTGQMRLAFLAVTTVILLSVIARSIAPLMARRSIDPTEVDDRERRYVDTRRSYTRRAYGVDAIHAESIGAGFMTAADAGSRVATWDGATLAQAAQRLRRVRVVGGAGWHDAGGVLSALLVERSSEGAEGRDVWGIGRFDPTSADDRGMPVRVTTARAPADELLLDEPAAYDSAPGYTVLSDSLARIAGVEMVSTRSRIAHAWALQNFRLLFGDLPLNRPTIVRRRDVRARIRALAPFFEQGERVAPVVAGDSLYWALELYAAADAYPLSHRFTLLGAERGYLRHAATALVHASSGRVQLVTDAAPEPITASWIARFPRLFVSATSLAPALQASLPPVAEGARAQALAFSVTGFRGDSLEVRHFATLDGADSAASREPLYALIPGGALAASWPLLDVRDRVRGLIVARGGAVRGTAWLPLDAENVRWSGVLDDLRASDSSGHESGLVRGPVRVIPVGGRPLYLQATFQWRPGGSPRLAHVATLAGDGVRAGGTLASALGLPARSPAVGVTAQRFRVRTDSLYRLMREALTHGDWPGFGRAFDALGASLRNAAP